MAGKTSGSAWKGMERVIAVAWTEALGLLCMRNVLSGSNNRSDTGKPRPGDIVIHPDFNADILVEAKLRAKFAHHALYRAAKADGIKHGFSKTLLYTRQKSERGYLVTMDADLFHEMLKVPQVQELLKKG